MSQNADTTCGSEPYDLRWNLSGQGVTVDPDEEIMLTFELLEYSPQKYYEAKMLCVGQRFSTEALFEHPYEWGVGFRIGKFTGEL